MCFTGGKSLFFPYFLGNPDFQLQIEENKVHFLTIQELKFENYEIRQFHLDFSTSIAVQLALEINKDTF